MNTTKNVQIPMDLFTLLIRYHLLEDESVETEEINRELQKKLDRLIQRERYTNYKTADDPAKREQARQDYLDAAGIHPDFRW